MWYVYVIECEKGSLYTGVAKDPEKRFQKHQEGKGAKYTRAYKPKKLLYVEKVGSRSGALKRELEIKSWTRKQKIEGLGLRLE